MSKGQPRAGRRARNAPRWALAWALALGWIALLGAWLEPAPRALMPGAVLGLVRVAPTFGAADRNTAHAATHRAKAARRANPPAPRQPQERPVPQPAPPPPSVAKLMPPPEPAIATRLTPPPPRAKPEPQPDVRARTPQAAPTIRPEAPRGGLRAPSHATKEPARRDRGVAQDDAPQPPGDTRSGADGDGPAVAPEQLDAGFRLLAPVSPAYPERAQLLGRGGEVRVELAVGRDGSVERVQVLDETGHWGFGHAVRRAYRGARFSPPTVRGRPVRVLWRQTVIFRP